MKTFYNVILVVLIGAISFLMNSTLLAQDEATISPVSSIASMPQQQPTLLQQLAARAQQQIQQQQAQAKGLGQSGTPVSHPASSPSSATVVAGGATPSAAKSNAVSGSVSSPSSVAEESSQQDQKVNTGNMYNEAFSGVVNQVLPMSPEQIGRLREIFNESQKAAATPPGIPPRPVTSSIPINLSPQAAPPVIRLGAGYITSLVFVDSTSQPWPIQAYSIGDPSAFNIQWDKKSNTLLIQAMSFYKRSNLAVILNGLDTPVMLTLLSGQEVVDYRVDLRVPGAGPNAIFVQNGLPDSANPILLDVLNGVPPKGSKTLKVLGGECQAWLLGERLFLRTDLDVISPAWKSVMSSADGTHAYELQVAPVILALQRGKDKTLILTVEGFE